MSKGKKSLRRAAANMLATIERGKTLDEAGDRLEGLDPRDAGFARAIVLMTLRRRRQIEQIMNDCIKKPIPRRPHIANALLQVGIVQLCFMDVAPHAAINETVNAVGKPEQMYRGLINGVLRNLARALEDKPDDPAIKQPDRINLPDWLADSWQTQYGANAMAQIADRLLQTPPLDLHFSTPEHASDWLTNYGADYNAEQFAPHHVRIIYSSAVDMLPEYDRGIWWIQDIAAQLPAQLFPEKADTLDLCAAPGGKTMQLSHLGHDVSALDISASRLSQLSQNLKRCGAKASLIEADLTTWEPGQQWHNVLLDAPCSATGTLRRHPDIALHRRASHIEGRAALQDTLLDRAFKLTKPGGTLIYCVCSLEAQEGEERAQAFSQRQAQLAPMPILPTEIPALLEAAITKDGQLRTRPDLLPNGLDGFFVARWRKLPG